MKGFTGVWKTSVSLLSAFACVLSRFLFCFQIFNQGEGKEMSLTVSTCCGLARPGRMFSPVKSSDASLISLELDTFSVSIRKTSPLHQAFPPSLRSHHHVSPPQNLRRSTPLQLVRLYWSSMSNLLLLLTVPPSPDATRDLRQTDSLVNRVQSQKMKTSGA